MRGNGERDPVSNLVSEFLATGIARVGQHPGVNPAFHRPSWQHGMRELVKLRINHLSCPPSVDEIGDPLAKTLAARLADKRSLPCVDPLVVLQGGQLLESFPTILPCARVRLLVCVVEHVLVEGLLERKGFPTKVARIWGLAWIGKLL